MKRCCKRSGDLALTAGVLRGDAGMLRSHGRLQATGILMLVCQSMSPVICHCPRVYYSHWRSISCSWTQLRCHVALRGVSKKRLEF